MGSKPRNKYISSVNNKMQRQSDKFVTIDHQKVKKKI